MTMLLAVAMTSALLSPVVLLLRADTVPARRR